MSSTDSFIWIKSSHSSGAGGECVEWAPAHATTGAIPVRDSKNPHGPVLMLTPTAWTGLITLARATA
ncbi:DUF397 domain-containing protein [Streptomyces yaizuensis]|uniref:DUF397 domain-containing protein n=1 Tax=Streptomyces yaizuensis TaxID=2989713 RepID=A0ABQ5NZX9_9ACTN|nr:DUF397 domain-containing protein [Streptomyces sp. YSPA8]GLF95911.1 DUF397 domain-containing protein [Streptomyces sp. YSPA8]